MNPQEIQKQNIEANKTKENINENQKSKDKLQKIIEKSNLKPETIENLKKILALVDINDLNDFIIGEPDLDDVINKGLKIDLALSLEGIIDNFLMKFGETKIDKKIQEKIKKDNFENIKEIDSNNLKNRLVNDSEKEKKQNQSEGIRLLNKNDSKYREIFKGDVKIISILDEIQTNKENHEKIAELLNKFLENKESATKFFNKIAKSGDTQLYTETIKSFENLGVTIPAHIPREIYKVPNIPEPIPKAVVAQFPGAKPEDIEKRGNLVSYGDKTIDLKTNKAYISGEKGYAIETSMQVPNSLDLRVKYQKERLEILDDIKTNEKIISLVENKENLEEHLKKIKEEKSREKKNQDDLELDIEITRIEKEVKKINEKLKQAIPSYKEEDDKNIKIFLEIKIEESEKSLKSLKEKFDGDMQELLNNGKDEIIKRDEKTKETLKFLDDLGITNINQNDLQKIINRININPQVYGFSKKINLKAGFEGTTGNINEQKEDFFNLFSKIYKKMGIPLNGENYEANYRILKAEHGNNKEKFNQNFKELLYIGGGFKFNEFDDLVKGKK